LVIFPEEPVVTQPTEGAVAIALATTNGPTRLHLTLGLIIQPTAPIYRVISNKARDHVVTTMLIAAVAMLFTAISYGRTAQGLDDPMATRAIFAATATYAI
jgi:hypothetical protein